MKVGARNPIKPKRRIPVSGRLLAAQAVIFAAALWLLISEWAPLAATDSPIRLIGKAMLYLILAWAGALGMTLWTYIALSLDSFRDLLRAAMLASLHALWFVPAMLVVNPPAQRLMAIAGMLLMANSARLLVSNPPPQRRMLSRRKLRMTHRLFAESRVQRGFFTKESFPAILGAFLLQTGSFAMWAGYPQWAAPLFASGIGCWTWVSMVRGAFPGRKRIHGLHRVVSATTALVLAIAFTVVRVGTEGGGALAGGNAAGNAPPVGWLQATREELRNLINPPQPKAGATQLATRSRPAPVRIVSATLEPDQLGKDGIPGLILQPGKKRPQELRLPPRYRLRVTLDPSKPVSIPFTGEYHLFRESSAQLPPGSVQRAGSPLEAIYVTTNGTPMETDAYQDFDPPVDFAPCAKIKMTLISGEVFPASATLILVGAEKVGELGPEIFGMSSDPEETLEFSVPVAAAGIPVRGIRIIFRHNPMEASHSTQVAVQRFTFVPRGL